MRAGRPRQSLSSKLLLLAVAFVLLTEILVFLPGLARERHHWLADRITQAHIAALSLPAAPGESVDLARRNELLRLSGSLEIRVHEPDREVMVLESEPPVVPAQIVDLRQEPFLAGMERALAGLLTERDTLVMFRAESGFRPDTLVEIVLNVQSLDRALRDFGRNFVALAALLAAVTGATVYFAVLWLFVRPIRRITGDIAAFRADPERTALLHADGMTALDDGEIAVAGRELVAMQQELRAALWRNARLAALGTGLAKVSHDLRNILAPALLSAERLQMHGDPTIQRSGTALVRAIDRATELAGRILQFAREGPPPLSLSTESLHRLVDEAAELIAAPHCRVENLLPRSLRVNADHDQLLRVLVNLVRNAAEAGAHHVRVALPAEQPENTIAIDVADDGPGLGEDTAKKLFQPFADAGKRGGTGLGLAIARDLMRAHGGDIALASTGPSGTVFRLTLPAAPVSPPEQSRAASGSPVAGELAATEREPRTRL
ncbi:MAG: HAMP domain-containing histidine kinase [Acetobacteraceae bacterium]|nr:HAMP domain-containing histidine kinase [Acetobacteraceae bacterium]